MIKKKILLFIITATLLVTFMTPSVKAADLSETSVFQILSALKIMNGDQNGNLNLNKNVTRAEFIKMVISSSVYKDSASSAYAVSPYPDVPSTHWASGYINTAKELGFITGYLDGTFRPNKTVKLEEAVTILLKLLGYSASDFTGVYPESQISIYKALKMDKNILSTIGTELTRRSCAMLVYNTLITNTKSGVVYATALGCPLDSTGNVDYLELVNSLLESPVVYTSGNISELVGFAPKMIYKNDNQASAGVITTYDVVYSLKEISTVWVYDNKITGKIEAISPSKSSPTSVTVNGKVYTLETSEAKLAVSNLGSFAVGNYATLLIGRDENSAVAVVNSSVVNKTIYGMVTGSSSKQYKDNAGNEYWGNYLTVIGTDGESYQYSYSKKALTTGTLVKISVSSSNGEPVIEKIYQNTNLSGKINATATLLGNYRFADNVEILDVCEQSAVQIEPERLANLKIYSDDVIFYQLNQNDEISHLMLDNVTNDMFEYGILTNVVEIDSNSMSQSNYEYIVNGQSKSLTSSYVFNLKCEPFSLLWVDNAPDTFKNLTKLALKSLTSTTAKSTTKSYTLSDNVQVYEKNDSGYHLSSAERINNLDSASYTLDGYYDKEESLGGRIRIVIATIKN